MKKLIIICEGPSEQTFCDKILKPHFVAIDINVSFPLIAHSNGGIVKWVHLKPDIELNHTADNNAFITTFIDYYGIKAHHGFPQWVNAHLQADRPTRMTTLEIGMLADLSATAQQKFIPNIQLHEFEALTLSDANAFGQYYAPHEFNNAGITALCANAPETVNNGAATAPSKQLKANIPAYDKVTDGTELAKLIGLTTIRAKCPRFNQWITKLEAL